MLLVQPIGSDPTEKQRQNRGERKLNLDLSEEKRMPNPIAVSIVLRPSEQKVLEKIVRSHTSEQRLVRRAQIVLKANEGQSNVAIAQALGVNRETVIRWRQRWCEEAEGLQEKENKEEEQVNISEHIQAILMDKPRPGAPVTFSAEQVVRIVAMACEDPETAGIPVSEWTPRELAQEAMRRGIVEKISDSSVERFLKRSQSSTPSQSLLAKCGA